MKLTFEVTWKRDDQYRFRRSENVLILLFEEWYLVPEFYASPLSTTLCFLFMTVSVNGRILPWLPNKIRKLLTRP